MKQQRYITFLKDTNGETLDFQRWSQKRISTVERNAVKLTNTFKKIGFFKNDTLSCIDIVDNDGNLLKTIPIAES